MASIEEKQEEQAGGSETTLEDDGENEEISISGSSLFSKPLLSGNSTIPSEIVQYLYDSSPIFSLKFLIYVYFF